MARPNTAQEATNVVVCGTERHELDRLVRVTREAGRWGIIPIAWPDAAGWLEARATAQLYLLHSGGSRSEELERLLGKRPDHAPLVVVGEEPARAAAPTVWLPTLPPSGLLGSVIDHLLAVDPGPPPPSWRRKTDMIIGTSPTIRQLLRSLDQLAPTQTPVIVTGESGVGKELVAQALHFCGPRAKAPFIAINCAAIPDNLFEAELFGYQRGAFTGAVSAHAGAFEAAHKGTLFLDEIGEMPLGLQAKLLRVLETSEIQRIGSTDRKKVNFRLVTATNRDLEAEVRAGRFRDDLYYRIQVYPLHVAPLRDRVEDIPPIATHHLAVIGIREDRPALRLTASALEKLVGYGWPGNVRELVNQLERAALVSGTSVIDADHIVLPQSGRPDGSATGSPIPYRDAKAKFELDYYSRLMRIVGGNVSLAAKLGQKTRKEVYDALKRLGLDAMAYRDLDASTAE